MSTLTEAVVRVHKLRVSLADCQNELATRTAAFNEANKALLTNVADDKAALALAESELRALTLTAYAADPTNKKPAPGVEIKVKTVRTYDPADALAWAKEKGMCLVPESLDVKAFEKIASVQSFSFMDVKEEPQAQIASDLSKHIPSEDMIQ